ncbi:helix-turn-helix domain-containing protein [Pelosinus sp. sgz500959]|uniref:helix-turn-helix domain-containing protein n=1 Tax=Pelosinus sp. sgz500959 TaxID=3242472 RepID=UPI003670E03F
MPVSYNPLWKLLIDKGLSKSQLKEKVNISTSTLAKMGKNEYIALMVLERICLELKCQLSDVCEINKDNQLND